MGCLKLTYYNPTLRVLEKNIFLEKVPLEKKGLRVKKRLNAYTYGFQGQERDDEIKGAGNSINYKYRMHDPRLGRFFAVDPLASKYPYNSPYAFSENRVVDGVELEGREFYFTINGESLGQVGKNNSIRVIDDKMTFEKYRGSTMGLYVNSTPFLKSQFREKVASRIYNDLGFDLTKISSIKIQSNWGIASYTPSTKVITLDTKEFYYNYYTTVNALVKENRHVEMKTSQIDAAGELEGYVAAAEHSSFDKVDESYRGLFLRGAGTYLFKIYQKSKLFSENDAYKNEKLAKINKDKYDNLVQRFSEVGVKFDFSELENQWRSSGDAGSGITRDVNSKAVNVTYKGKQQ